MKPVILLIGKNGQVGGELLPLLPKLGELVALDRKQMDLSKPDDVRRTIREIRPQLIVNAAAYTAVDRAETDESMAHAVNTEAPELIAAEAKKIGAGLVHYSTDYVFDGAKLAPYDEADPTNPLNVYGKTKLAGEQAIRSSGASHLIFRTSWVYATCGKNFLLTVLRLALEREELRIVGDQVGAPTCASQLAATTCQILTDMRERNQGQFSFSEFSGIYHMTAAGQTTWCEFAKSIVEEAQAISHRPKWLADATNGRVLLARRVIPISTAEFNSPTKRPIYSVLSNSLLMQKFGVSLPDWRAQLKRCFESERTVTIIAVGNGTN